MTGCEREVPDAERRRAANAALTEIIEEVCRHYAPSGARVEDCWEAGEAGDGVTLRVFLTGPMQGSWTDMATGARGDALDLVARLGSLDAAGALAEAERFLGRNAARPEPESGDVGGQMGLFGALPESRRRKRPARRPGKARNAGPSRQAAAKQQPQADDPVPRPGDDPEGAGDAADGSQEAPDAPAPENRKQPSTPANSADGAGPGPLEPGHAAPPPEGVGFTAEDRQRLRKAAEDAAWLRSRQTIRSLDAEAQARSRARRQRHDRRWRRTALKAAVVLALAVFGNLLGVMGEYRYGVVDMASVLGAELPEDARIPLGGDGT